MFDFTSIKTKITNVVGAIVEAAQKKTVDTLFSMFWIGNYYLALLEKHFDKNNSHWLVQKILWRNPTLKEPYLDFWYSCTTLTKRIDGGFGFNEKYTYSGIEIQDFVPTEIEKCYISRMSDYYISKIGTPKINYHCIDTVPEKSKVKFISILYGHKNMSNILTLKLDPMYLREGNNLFSKSFVLRLLKYSYTADQYVFDENYELKVMDDKIRTTVLGFNKYMVLDSASKTGYTIINVE